MPWVDLLKCADGSYYTGLAQDDLDRRLWEHQNGVYHGYTSSRRPLELVWSGAHDRFDEAIAFERQVKGWSRRKKEALVRGDFALLPELASRRGGKPKS